MKKIVIILVLLLISFQGQCNKVLSFNETVYTSRIFSSNHLNKNFHFYGFHKSQAALSGDYTVGTTGFYNTITAAVNALNSNGVSGPVRFLLCDASYTTSETFPITINITSNLPTSVNTVTFKPNSGVTALIKGNPTSSPAINEIFIVRNSYVIFDGANTDGGTSRDLTIENSSVIFPVVLGIYSSGTTPVSGFTAKNCILINGVNSSNNNPVVRFSDLASYSYGYYNNFIIQNNSFQKAYTGIAFYGVETAGNGTGTIITGNDMNSSGTNCISGTGIYINGADGITVSNNNISNITNVDNGLITGIRILNKTINANVSGNSISNIVTTSSSSGSVNGIYVYPSGNAININISNNSISELSSSGTSSYSSGIYCSGNNVNITNNSVSNIKNTNISGYSVSGILLASASANAGITAANNLIYDITGYGRNSSTERNGYGINISSGGRYNIYFNSVNLAANQTLATGVPACLFINSTVTASNCLDIRNNIFSIPATVGSNRYSVLSLAPATVFSNLNYNDYYTSGPNLGYLGSNRTNLTNWQSATGKDQFSVSADPGFTSNSDLQINVNDSKCWNVNAGALPLSSVSTDFSNNPRNTSVDDGACDIGAYEFTPLTQSANLSIDNNFTNNGTSAISFAGTTLATITWHTNNGALPSDLTAVYQPGVNPPCIPGGNKYANENFAVTAPDGSGYLYDISYHYNLARQGIIESESAFRLAKYSNSNWFQYSQTPNQTNKTITVAGLNSFSVFAFGDGSAPLPVELSSFNYTINKRNVILIWKTDEEINNSGFDIERNNISTNEWLNAGHVFGKGNSVSPVTYSFEDKNLNTGKYNYRLKQIDYNGNYTFLNLSAMVEISSPTRYSMSQNYPNPFNPVTNIDFDLPVDSKVTLSIYDITGKKIKTILNESMQAGYHTIQFNASSFSSGIYFYTLYAKSPEHSFIKTNKMLLLK